MPHPLHRSPEIQSADHNAGMHHLVATVTAVNFPSPHLARVRLQIPHLHEEAQWTRPNVALRFYLDERYDEVSRVYTVRSCDPATDSIDVDIVRHGTTSPMMRWLADITEGSSVEIVGPRPHFQIPDNARTRPLAVFADSTAIPAVFTLLNAIHYPFHGQGWIATDDDIAFMELPQFNHFPLQRVNSDSEFLDQAQALVEPAQWVVWAGGERDAMKALRRYFRTEIGLAKEDAQIAGYWKHGTSNTEIDQVRLTAYRKLLAAGGTVTDLDDLNLSI